MLQFVSDLSYCKMIFFATGLLSRVILHLYILMFDQYRILIQRFDDLVCCLMHGFFCSIIKIAYDRVFMRLVFFLSVHEPVASYSV